MASRFSNHSFPANGKRAERYANQLWGVGMKLTISAFKGAVPMDVREAIQAFIINQSWNDDKRRTSASPARNKEITSARLDSRPLEAVVVS
ncbi:hypothetical protein [Rhizobium sp. 768_B6_N1_8]|uniref:hypothetical protein n=1 Tax=unclassified Rhizobium TaxID=2613769 RepID=UPI003F298C6C